MKTMTKTIAFACATLMSFAAGARDISNDEIDYILTKKDWVSFADGVDIAVDTIVVVNHYTSAWYRMKSADAGTVYLEITINCAGQKYSAENYMSAAGDVVNVHEPFRPFSPNSELGAATVKLCRAFAK